LLLLVLELKLHFIERLAAQELRVEYDLSQRPIAWRDVSLDDLLKSLVGLVADHKFRADVGTNCLLFLLDVDVHDGRLKELPGQREVINATARRPEVELAGVLTLQLPEDDLARIVDKTDVLDASHGNLHLRPRLQGHLLLHGELLVDEVLLGNVLEFTNELIKPAQIGLLALEVDGEVLVLFGLANLDAVDTALDNAALLRSAKEVSIVLMDVGVQAVLEATHDARRHLLVLDEDLDDGGGNNHALLECLRSLIDQAVEELRRIELLLGEVPCGLVSRVLEWVQELLDEPVGLDAFLELLIDICLERVLKVFLQLVRALLQLFIVSHQ
jgi:hypothetical protein